MQKGRNIRALLTLGSLLGFAPVTFAEDNVPRLSDADLKEVVAPIALYPDDLVAVVLPAASYPLQLVQAQRVLDDGGSPDADWDEAVVAIMNYPEVVEYLNEDLDWTYGLGLAFINQEADVFNAIQDFRADALAAGNLKSDSYQDVRVDNNGNILIEPRAKDTLYVPYYEPRRVVVRHVTPVYHYYPIARPVYYYPYPASYSFNVGHFYGVGTYFSIGWQYRGLNLFYSTALGHPYAGRHYNVRYSPRHFYFQPRVRHQVVVNHRHHYKPKYNKPVKHRAKHVRANNNFRSAKHVRNNTVQNKRQLNRPQHRLARDSIKQTQQRKQAKFRDARQERQTFGRKQVAQRDVSRKDANRRDISRRDVSRRDANRTENRRTVKQQPNRQARRDAPPQVKQNARSQVRQNARPQVRQNARPQVKQQSRTQVRQQPQRQKVRQQPQRQVKARSGGNSRSAQNRTRARSR